MRVRALLVSSAVLLTAGCLGDFEKGSGDPSIDPLSLLADRPALPRDLDMEGWQWRVRWHRTLLGPRVEDPLCEIDAGAFRGWAEGRAKASEEDDLGASPSVDQVVCVFSSEGAADDGYDSLSLADVAGEDWPNFDYGETKPANASDLDDLVADEWEIGCGVGNPDAVCAVWDFRARYDNVLTDVEFFMQGGGIRLPAMHALIRSIDRHVATRLRSG